MKCPACRCEYPHHKIDCHNRVNEKKIRDKERRDHQRKMLDYRQTRVNEREKKYRGR